VGAEDGLGGARRRGDDGGHGAEAEEHEVGAVLGGERGEGDGWEGAHEVEVRRWPMTGSLFGGEGSLLSSLSSLGLAVDAMKRRRRSGRTTREENMARKMMSARGPAAGASS
jgi:hypothetical protein